MNNNIVATESFPLNIENDTSFTSLVSNNTPSPNQVIETRQFRYNHISKYLQSLNDENISNLLKNEISIYSDWGCSIKLEVDEIHVFVKMVPLNEIEGRLENIGSTENLFDIPTYYQYGVNSGGFSAWRELSAHIMTTEWVLANENQNFPIMYHYRIINNSEEKAPLNEEELKNYVKYWNNSPTIEKRIRANHNSSAFVALFIEYIPDTLNDWLIKQLNNGSINNAIEMVDRNLKETITFINSKGMLHFDSHFLNILTDGNHLYLSDFGLTTCSQFMLSEEEMKFFLNHKNYDKCYVVTEITSWIISKIFGKDRLDEVLQEYANGKTPILLPETLTPYISSIIKRYAPITLRMNTFFKTLREETKQTPYPADELDRLLVEGGLNF